MTRFDAIIYGTLLAIICACAAGLSCNDRHAPPDRQVAPGRVRTLANVLGASTFDRVSVYHDDVAHVTCWAYATYQAGGISCLRDDPEAGVP